MTAACVTDAPGSSKQIGHTAQLLAEVAARMGARRSVFAGLSAAGELVAVPQANDDDDSDAVAVLATIRSSHTSIAWVGDCRAYSWDGERIVQASTDQTMARWLAEQGNGHYGVEVPEDLSAFGNVYMRITLGLASAATIREVQVVAGLTVILPLPTRLSPRPIPPLLAKWCARYLAKGEGGPVDRSSRPISSPNRTGGALADLIEALRQQTKYGPTPLSAEPTRLHESSSRPQPCTASWFAVASTACVTWTHPPGSN